MASVLEDSANLQKAASKGSLVVLNFWATWAEPCKHLNEVFDELAAKYPAGQFFKVEAEAQPELSEQFEIVAVPTFVIIQGGKAIDRVEGANAAELSKRVAKYAAQAQAATPAAAPAAAAGTTGGKDLNARLKELVNVAECVAFIKGTPTEPRCGFTRQLVEIFEKHKVKYSSFNILADDEVREGLKTFSNWPTYPQVYVKGEFVGGLDIIKELEANNELEQTVPIKKEEDLNTRLKNLINKAPVMLFMKGSPSQPKCGFSKKMVALLDENKATYESFDILTDDGVRQGLKTFSNWPTYPQLYVRGELIGGLDIVQELIEAGELQSTLSG